MASSLTFFKSLFPTMVIEALLSSPCRRWHRRQAGFPSSLCRLWWLLGRIWTGIPGISPNFFSGIMGQSREFPWAPHPYKSVSYGAFMGENLGICPYDWGNKHPAASSYTILSYSSYSRVSFGIFWMGRSWTYWDLIGEDWGYPKMDTGNLDWSTKNGDGISSEYHGIISEWLIHLIPTSRRDVSVDCGFLIGTLAIFPLSFPPFLGIKMEQHNHLSDISEGDRDTTWYNEGYRGASKYI